MRTAHKEENGEQEENRKRGQQKIHEKGRSTTVDGPDKTFLQVIRGEEEDIRTGLAGAWRCGQFLFSDERTALPRSHADGLRACRLTLPTL